MAATAASYSLTDIGYRKPYGGNVPGRITHEISRNDQKSLKNEGIDHSGGSCNDDSKTKHVFPGDTHTDNIDTRTVPRRGSPMTPRTTGEEWILSEWGPEKILRFEDCSAVGQHGATETNIGNAHLSGENRTAEEETWRARKAAPEPFGYGTTKNIGTLQQRCTPDNLWRILGHEDWPRRP